jgi:hypothetical protein
VVASVLCSIAPARSRAIRLGERFVLPEASQRLAPTPRRG